MALVYLADQDASFRKGLAHALRQRGTEVMEFESGSELYARTVANEPDLIAMDTDLEDMDGFQVFARLQRKRPQKPFPVVFVTEFDHPRVARAVKQQGALGFVGKNRSLDQVVERIHSFLTDRDPLYERKLPAALAWLQSRGKSGRLDVEAHGERGFVLLHKGTVLEAHWRSLEGDEALTFFAEGLPEAEFRFAEGMDETEPAPLTENGDRPAAAAGAPALAEPELDLPPVAPEEQVAAQAGAKRSSSAPPARPSPIPRKPAAAALRSGVAVAEREVTGVSAATGGSLQAVQELLAAQRGDAGKGAGFRHASRRAAMGLAAGVALLLLAGAAVAVFFPESLPSGVAAILRGHVIPVEERDVTEAAPQLARSEVEPGGAVPVSGYGGPAGAEETGTNLEATSAEATPAPATEIEDVAGAERPGPAPAPADRAPPPPAPAEVSRARATDERPSPARPAAGERRGGEAERLAAARRREEAEASIADRARRETQPAEPAAEGPAAEGPAAGRELTTEGAPELAAAAGPPAADVALATETGAGREDAPARGGRRRASAGQRAPAPDVLKKPVLLQRGTEPYYPPELKAQGVGGSVVLNIRVGTNGRAQQVEVQRTSGYEAFDQAAVAAVGTFLWEPARDATGTTETWITQAVSFRP